MSNSTQSVLFQIHLDTLNCIPDFGPFILLHEIFGDYINQESHFSRKSLLKLNSNEGVNLLHHIEWGKGYPRLTRLPKTLTEKEIADVRKSITNHIRNFPYEEGIGYLEQLIGALALTYPSDEIRRYHLYQSVVAKLGEGEGLQDFKKNWIPEQISISDDEFRYIFCIEWQLAFLYGSG